MTAPFFDKPIPEIDNNHDLRVSKTSIEMKQGSRIWLIEKIYDGCPNSVLQILRTNSEDQNNINGGCPRFNFWLARFDLVAYKGKSQLFEVEIAELFSGLSGSEA